MVRRPSRRVGDGLQGLGIRERIHVVRAVRDGTAVSDKSLAPTAVAYARRLQSRPPRGSLAWFLSVAEVGPLAAAAVAVVVIYLVHIRNDAVLILLLTALVAAMVPVSRRRSSHRRRQAAAAENANLRQM